VRILIVDDHPVVREGIAGVLAKRGDIDAVWFAVTGEAVSRILDEEPEIDLALIDLKLPKESGFEILKLIGDRRPEVPVMMLSSSEDVGHVKTAISRGALGYVPKSASPAALLGAVAMILAGEIYVPAIALGPMASPRTRGPLTERQLEILRLTARPLSSKAIARDLDLSEKTVKAHLTAIYRLLEVTTRADAIAAAKSLGLV
jgi:two-component system nitrate/nitrite response regulator NarL